MATKMFWGDSLWCEFWESKDRHLLVTRVLSQSTWAALRYGTWLGESYSSADAAAKGLGGVLDNSRAWDTSWAGPNGHYVLSKPRAGRAVAPISAHPCPVASEEPEVAVRVT